MPLQAVTPAFIILSGLCCQSAGCKRLHQHVGMVQEAAAAAEDVQAMAIAAAEGYRSMTGLSPTSPGAQTSIAAGAFSEATSKLLHQAGPHCVPWYMAYCSIRWASMSHSWPTS